MMDNLHLFQLINAGPGLGAIPLGVVTALAQWLIYLVPITMAVGWVRGGDDVRRDLLHILLGALLALGIAQIVTQVWPQPRPFTLHLGTQYLAHGDDPGLPSDHVTVFWSLALSTLTTRRLALWSLPLLVLGLVVGWSRVYLGVHFPYDILGAFPVALAGAALAQAFRPSMSPVFGKVIDLNAWLTRRLVDAAGAKTGRR